MGNSQKTVEHSHTRSESKNCDSKLELVKGIVDEIPPGQTTHLLVDSFREKESESDNLFNTIGIITKQPKFDERGRTHKNDEKEKNLFEANYIDGYENYCGDGFVCCDTCCDGCVDGCSESFESCVNASGDMCKYLFCMFCME